MELPSPKLCRAVVFDLDGTLIDSAPDLAAALDRLLVEEGSQALGVEAVKMLIGDGAQRLVERAFYGDEKPPDGAGEDLTRCYLSFYEGHEADHSRPFPGLAECLAGLVDDGHVLGVCTNKPQDPAVALLDHFGLGHFFPVIVGGDRLDGVRKPDPRHLQAVLDGLGVDAGDAVFVGDNENDAKVAHAVGLPLVLVSFGYARVPIADLGAAAVIDAYADLPAALAGLP